MHRRYEKSNIPIELLRTLIAISESGSFTKAAEAQKLSQSAVSAQIKRLEQLVAGRLFAKSGLGLRLTALGELVLGYARRILTMNDQILALGGLDPKVRQCTLGIPSGLDSELLVELVKRLSPASAGEAVQFRAESQDGLLRGLEAGHVDIAFIADPQRPPPRTAVEWFEPLYWVRSPDCFLSPGAPIPLVSSPGSVSDRAAVRALENSGIPYCMAFTTESRALRRAAVFAGIGFMVVAERSVRVARLNIARDHYLPSLPVVRSGLYLREGLDTKRVARILQTLESILKPAGVRQGTVDAQTTATEIAKDIHRNRRLPSLRQRSSKA